MRTISMNDELFRTIQKTQLGSTTIFEDQDGFINAAKFCKKFGARIGDWKCLAKTKALITSICDELGLDEDTIMYCIKGGSHQETWGTYVPPAFIISISYWISPTFGAKIVAWIEEWKLSGNNQERYHQAIASMIPYQSNHTEAEIRDSLAARLPNSRTEVPVGSRRIDLLTDHLLVEIKNDDWMKAIGQLDVYGDGYPEHEKVLYLFGSLTELDEITRLCHAREISVVTTWQEVVALNRNDMDVLVVVSHRGSEDYYTHSLLSNKRRSSQVALARLRKTFPMCQVVIRIRCLNASKLWTDYLKQSSARLILDDSNRSFDLTKRYTEKKMLRDLIAARG